MGSCLSARHEDENPCHHAGVSTPRTEDEILNSPALKSFSYSVLRHVTRNFQSPLGEGGFGCVYRGSIDEVDVAVKKLNQDGTQGHKEWLAEIRYLGQFSHPNLVKLLGYCLEDNQRLLVYELMPQGSLDNHLFNRKGLAWNRRLRAALGAARGLAYLHNPENKVIFRDFKAANVLLDSDYNAKISDFGLARNGPVCDDTHVTTRVLGTQGYAAPEYISTGHLTWKCDVYSFGIVLVEILSGQSVNQKPDLCALVEACMLHKQNIIQVIDKRVQGQYTMKAVYAVAGLAVQCVSMDPTVRPSMAEVVRQLEIFLGPRGRRTTE